MKNLVFLSIFFAGMLFISAQNYYMQSPEGFGASTTGGGDVTPVTVDNYNDFKTNLQSTSPKVILVSGTITLSAGQGISEVVVDKTIIGLPGARLINNTQTQSGSGILNLKDGSNNVIIRNLIFEGPGAYDIDGRDNLTAEGCTNLWVDHCEFQDGLDGNFDIKNTSDNITISWCKFTYLKPPIAGGSGGSNDHRFSNLVGASSSNAPEDGHFSVTYMNCYWAEGCKERMPRARNAELHILNCYYNTDVTSSKALGLGGGTNNLTCYVENSDFAGIGTVYSNYSGSDGGTVSVTFDNCLNGVADVGTVTPPSYSYSVQPVEDVANTVTNTSCGAGATLQVTASGALSSSCNDLGLEEPNAEDIKIYPTAVDAVLSIHIPFTYDEKTEIHLHSMQGQEVFFKTCDINMNRDITINVSDLAKGLYFCTLKTKHGYKTALFIKK